MPARTGAEFLGRLSSSRTHVEIQGQTLTGGVAEHPAFRNVVRSYVGLFDMQHDPMYRNVLTYPSPLTGEPVATSFLLPRTAEDLVKRREAFALWADRSLGMLGRTGDYLNSALMALASAADWFGQADAGFARNIRAYYEKVREEDLLCTHTLIPPQANRAVSGSQQGGGTLMAHVVREDDNGSPPFLPSHARRGYPGMAEVMIPCCSPRYSRATTHDHGTAIDCPFGVS